jgi:hypothetical protein
MPDRSLSLQVVVVGFHLGLNNDDPHYSGTPAWVKACMLEVRLVSIRSKDIEHMRFNSANYIFSLLSAHMRLYRLTRGSH